MKDAPPGSVRGHEGERLARGAFRRRRSASSATAPCNSYGWAGASVTGDLATDLAGGRAGGLAGRARQALRWAIDWALPPVCVGCRARLATSSSCFGLCLRCRGQLREHHGTRCAGCARPLRSATPPPDRRCGECRLHPPPWRRLLTLWDYAPPADQVLLALKFHRVEGLARRISDRVWDRHAEEMAEVDALVPIPLPWSRRIVRGFNQTEALARPLALRLGKPIVQPLRRTPSAAMSSLDPAERRRRARRSLRLRPRCAVPERVLLVDDVFTTGATLLVASRLLRRGGAREVLAIAPFWTPPRSQGRG